MKCKLKSILIIPYDGDVSFIYLLIYGRAFLWDKYSTGHILENIKRVICSSKVLESSEKIRTGISLNSIEDRSHLMYGQKILEDIIAPEGVTAQKKHGTKFAIKLTGKILCCKFLLYVSKGTL